MFNTKIQNRYKDVFNTPAGQEVLKDLLRFCKYGEPGFVPGAPDISNYNSGMQRVAQRIASFLWADPIKRASITNELKYEEFNHVE